MVVILIQFYDVEFVDFTMENVMADIYKYFREDKIIFLLLTIQNDLFKVTTY